MSETVTNGEQGLLETTGNTYQSIPAEPGDTDELEPLVDDESTGSPKEQEDLPTWDLVCIMSLSFSYGCTMTTLFLITLPVECARIEHQHPDVPKSVALGVFVALSGLTNLVSPLAGMLSDTYMPPKHFELGQRMPYFVLGGICSVVGLLGQYIESNANLWLRYGVFFVINMIGLNISYAMMIALIPDQVPKDQTGTANGILAFLLVLGSLTGFGLFQVLFKESVQDMYGLYVVIVVITTLLTALHAHERDAALNAERGRIIARRKGERRSRRRMILGPLILLKTMLYDPLVALDGKALIAIYSIDIERNFDFFIVTVSRLCYYCGVSVQAFFLYFLQDIIHVEDDAEASVAYLAVLGQIAGSLVCYPVGFASDHLFGGRRKPFIYLSCLILGLLTCAMIFARTFNNMMILCSILGAANGMYLTMETSLAVDSLPHDFEDGLSGGHAQLLGIWGVAAFLGTALGPMIGGPLLYMFGHQDTEAAEASDQTYTIEVSLRWIKNQQV